MEKKLKREIKLKNGEIIPKGSMVNIAMDPVNPAVVILSGPGFSFKSASAKLYNKFPGFVNPFAEIKDPENFDCCVVSSLTGKMVEPDGFDEKGFPSVLLAMGMI